MTTSPTAPTPYIRRMLYVGGFDFPTTQARGIQSLHTAHALARVGIEVRLLVQRATGRRAPPADALTGYGLAPHPRLTVVPLAVARADRIGWLEIHKRLALTNWSYGAACLLDLIRTRTRPDVVFTRDPRLAWLFIRSWRVHRVPVVYEVHEIFSTRPRDNTSLVPGEVWGVADRTRALERAVFAEADFLFPLTTACSDLLHHEFGVPRGRMAVLPDGTTPPTGALPPRDPKARTVVYAGQLYAWKGVDVLLRAMALLPEATLTVIGGSGTADGHDPDLARCRALAAELQIGDRVAFTGFVPHAEVRGRLAGAGVAVVPLPDRLMSRFFTSPLKVFDYMAAGVPIVASDLPALHDVLQDGENALLVPPDDPGALATAIRRLLVNPGLADRLRRTAFEGVGAFTWDARAARILEALRPPASG